MEAIRSSETSVHTRSTQYHIPEDGILHSHRRENSNLTGTEFFTYRHIPVRIDSSYEQERKVAAVSRYSKPLSNVMDTLLDSSASGGSRLLGHIHIHTQTLKGFVSLNNSGNSHMLL
jgi:hypothetical protein